MPFANSSIPIVRPLSKNALTCVVMNEWGCKMDIQTTIQPNGYWIAIDADDYDCDCDENGFFSNSPAGYGKTEQEAIDELLAEIWQRNASDEEIAG